MPLFLYLATWELGEELGDDDLEHLVGDGGEHLVVILKFEGGEDGGEVIPGLEKLCGDEGVWAQAKALGRGIQGPRAPPRVLEWIRVEGGRDVGLKSPLREDEQAPLLTNMEGANGEDGSHPATIPSRSERVDLRMEGAGDDCFPGPVRQLRIPSVSLPEFPFQIRRGSQWRI